MFEPKLNSACQAVFSAQAIDQNHPGPVLRDFQVLLDYVGPSGLEVAGKYNLLPLNAIKPLNEQLSRPLRLGLERPQLRSHPYLQGLYLLLRASGLTRVEGVGAKARLVVNPAALASWEGLNPTERYFTLLEAWLLVGDWEMVGEQAGRPERLLDGCLQTWQNLRHLSKRFPAGAPPDSYRYISHRFLEIALMDLFGLASVGPVSGLEKGWRPNRIELTLFGNALLTLLAEWENADDEEEEEEEEDEGEETYSLFGTWQKLLQPYFPEWRANLRVPRTEWREGAWVFRVSVGPIWRLIAISSEDTLDGLVAAILQSVAFDFDHLYQWRYRDELGGKTKANHPGMEEGLLANEVQIGGLPLQIGGAMKMWYDFGDDWWFEVRLERIDPPGKGKLPRVLKRHGKAPSQYGGWDD